MLFAAGFGTRMRHLTDHKPKPLVQVAGRALIDHALALAHDVGVHPIVVNLHYQADMLDAHLQGTSVLTVREEPTILDTGGGLKNALNLLGNHPLVTMNTDAVWAGPNPIRLLLDAWKPEQMDALLICVPIQQVHGRKSGGDFHLDDDGRLHRAGDAVYGGVQILKTDLLNTIEDSVFSLNVIWDLMHKQGRLFGLTYPGQWCDVGHPEGIAEAEAMLAHSDV
jgi:N-acetyl-alpha-D-muramate 1-phosphate uridylyltransferase